MPAIDDIVILSESEEGLQKMLQYLSNYMRGNRMEIHSKKTV